MRRGTTPTHIFKSKTRVDLTNADVIFVSYYQGKNWKSRRLVVEKTKDDLVELTADRIKVKFSQEETLKFSTSERTFIQVRVGFPGEDAIASQIIETTIQAILKEGVI